MVQIPPSLPPSFHTPPPGEPLPENIKTALVNSEQYIQQENLSAAKAELEKVQGEVPAYAKGQGQTIESFNLFP